MTYKQQIVEALAQEIRPILPECNIISRSNHGCWEVIVRRGGIKIVECTLTGELGDRPENDELYISHNGVYDNTRKEVLSDPTWIDRFLKEIKILHCKATGLCPDRN